MHLNNNPGPTHKCVHHRWDSLKFVRQQFVEYAIIIFCDVTNASISIWLYNCADNSYLFSILWASTKCFLASKADCICFCSSQDPSGVTSFRPISGNVTSILVAPLATISSPLRNQIRKLIIIVIKKETKMFTWKVQNRWVNLR